MKILGLGGASQPINIHTSGMPIRDIALPRRVVLPMSQHTGNPAIPIVATGDSVRRGQIVGRADGFASVNIHTPISGTVTSITTLPDHIGRSQQCITIDAGDSDHFADLQAISDARPILDQNIIDALTPQQIIDKVREAGIVSRATNAIPTHVNLTIPDGRHIDTLIINCAECEPHLSCDERLMLEMPAEVASGIELLRRAINAPKGIIAIESNKIDAIARMTQAVHAYPTLSVVTMRTKQMQRGNNRLTEAITRRRIPEGGRPIDAGAVVDDVATALAVYHAIYWRMPLTERVITITGSKTPYGNLRVPLGCLIDSTLQHLGGIPDDIARIMTDDTASITHTDAPITKQLSGIIMLTEAEARHAESCNNRRKWWQNIF